MSEPPNDEPPPDGGPLLFGLSFLGLPLAGIAATLAISKSGHRAETALDLGPFVVAIFAGAAWVYFSRSPIAIILKSGLLGALATAGPLVFMYFTVPIPQGDDVAPLFYVFAAPLIVLAGVAFASMCAFIVIFAFWARQRERGRWLEYVRSGAHPRYRVIPLTANDARKRAFLRYQRCDAGALCRWTAPDYRGSPQGKVIARVP
ncbi:MAG: hypothetical protein ABIP39_12510 [Polyangiaceae bacterium]